MIRRKRNDFPVPALPVKKIFLPLLTASKTVVCSLESMTGFVTVTTLSFAVNDKNFVKKKKKKNIIK